MQRGHQLNNFVAEVEFPNSLEKLLKTPQNSVTYSQLTLYRRPEKALILSIA